MRLYQFRARHALKMATTVATRVITAMAITVGKSQFTVDSATTGGSWAPRSAWIWTPGK